MSREPRIDALTGTVIAEPDESAEGGVTPSLLVDEHISMTADPIRDDERDYEEEAANRREQEREQEEEALAEIQEEAAKVYATLHEVAAAVVPPDAFPDARSVASAAFAYWLGNTVG